MIKKDFMKEIENSLKIVKREVDKNIINGNISEAKEAINNQLKGLVGLDIMTIDTLSFSSVIDIISREDEFNGEKYIALGELLCLQGFVCQSTGDEEGQIKYYLKSIDALNEAFREDSDIEKRYFQDGIHISDLLSVYDLTINENKKIFKFYEIVGKYDKAEDILFYMIKKSNKDKNVIAMGINYYEKLKKQDERIRVETWKMDDARHSEKHGFNYAAIQNFAAKKANGEYLLLLNNDTQVIDPDFLVSMVGYARRSDVGAVGAKLLYEDDTVQHAGVIVGVEGVAFHQFLEYPEHDPGYMGRASFSQDLSAVTGACLLIRKKVYEEVGGMDEHLAVSYNDVDLCLKLREAGYLVVYDAFAHLYHYESRSRGYEDSPQKQARLAREAEYMKNKWKHVMGTDPYYNRNLSLKNGYYKLP